MLRKLRLHNNLIGTLLLLLFLTCSLLTSPYANAASDYDDTVVRADSLNIKTVGSHPCDLDITTDWNSILHGTYTGPGGTVYRSPDAIYHLDELDTAYSNGIGWAAVQSILPAGDTQQMVDIYATPDSSKHAIFRYSGGHFVMSGQYSDVFHIVCGDSSIYVDASSPTTREIAWSDADASSIGYQHHPMFVNYTIDYPTGYAGEQLLNSDSDGDGLNSADEITQGTSDTKKDTDRDGLDDYTESQWNPNRTATFCGSECAYPNPTEKDLYVEVDWMKDSNNRTLMPSTTQLAYVTNTLSNHGIVAHFDTGEYGGGNELPVYTQDLSFYRNSSATDFYDYKYGNLTIPANFNSDRYHIWHYMIAGYRYTQDPKSSGASYTGDDDSFISAGLIKSSTSSFPHALDTDHAIAGTILHELGHSMCLSNSREYSTQPSNCIYAGIHTLDNPTYDPYHSVMNYTYQMTGLVNFSNGQATPEDHDDWSGVAEGMHDFAQSEAEGENPSTQFMQPNFRTRTPQIRHITP